jgi:hypothetical protein
MSSTIKIKRSGNTIAPAALGSGELAYSWFNNTNKLYIGTGTETDGAAANIDVIGGKYYVDILDAATNLSTASTLVKRDGSGNFSANTITAALAGNASTATTWQTARNLSLTGDATATLSGVNGGSNVSATLTLATVNSNVGTFGSTTAIPVVTVNEKGLVTAVSTTAISTTLNILGDTGTDAVALGADTLDFEGGTGVTTAVTDNKVTFSIGQAVNTTSNVTFNNVSVNGTLTSDDITAANISIAGNATITGNLTVQGTTTTVNSTTVAISDINIVLAKDATTAAQADGGGITLAGANATITYNSTTDRWNLNKPLQTTTVYADLVGNASTASTLQTARTISATGDAAWTTSFDGSQNVTGALTLATVNSNVGTFGNSVTVPAVTVNAKGLVTAVSQTAIPTATAAASAAAAILGLAKFSNANFSVDSGFVTVTALDGGIY